MLRQLIFSIALVVAASSQAADNSSIAAKAARFYDQKEWASASAMYSLLLEERPADAALYGRAIVADGMRGDTAAQLALMQKAIDHHVAFDSVFSRVETNSFALGKAAIYEHFLLNLQGASPWLKRAIDAHLLDYYAFRRNPAKIEHYAEIMLQGMPEGEDYLYALGEAYVTGGQMDKAEEAFKRIVSLNPRAYVALLYLGNRAIQTGNSEGAKDYLERAQAIKSTPHVAKLLQQL